MGGTGMTREHGPWNLIGVALGAVGAATALLSAEGTLRSLVLAAAIFFGAIFVGFGIDAWRQGHLGPAKEIGQVTQRRTRHMLIGLGGGTVIFSSVFVGMTASSGDQVEQDHVDQAPLDGGRADSGDDLGEQHDDDDVAIRSEGTARMGRAGSQDTGLVDQLSGLAGDLFLGEWHWLDIESWEGAETGQLHVTLIELRGVGAWLSILADDDEATFASCHDRQWEAALSWDDLTDGDQVCLRFDGRRGALQIDQLVRTQDGSAASAEMSVVESASTVSRVPVQPHPGPSHMWVTLLVSPRTCGGTRRCH